MYCPQCGKPSEHAHWRCPECHRPTTAFRRNLLAAAVVLACGIVMALMWEVFQVWINIGSGLMIAFPQWALYGIAANHAIVSYGLWFVLVYLILALLLRKKLGGVFVSGRLALSLAGLFLLVTLVVASVAAAVGAIHGSMLVGFSRVLGEELHAHQADSSLRKIVAAENAYFAAHHPGAYACNVKDLDPEVAKGTRELWNFDVHLACSDAKGQGYRVMASPRPSYEYTAYCTDEHGAIRSLVISDIHDTDPAKSSERCLKNGKPLKL